ncbi:MAG: hypothetical protein U9Q29_03840 [Campylobacterota bacterium]|nr:hypothetical protein [Campylobacterota bacterium]
MKINFNSLTFKTISTLLITSTLFVLFIVFGAKYLFSNGYLYLEKRRFL